MTVTRKQIVAGVLAVGMAALALLAQEPVRGVSAGEPPAPDFKVPTLPPAPSDVKAAKVTPPKPDFDVPPVSGPSGPPLPPPVSPEPAPPEPLPAELPPAPVGAPEPTFEPEPVKPAPSPVTIIPAGAAVPVAPVMPAPPPAGKVTDPPPVAPLPARPTPTTPILMPPPAKPKPPVTTPPPLPEPLPPKRVAKPAKYTEPAVRPDAVVPFRFLMWMGDGKRCRFEVKRGDSLVLKVYADRITVKANEATEDEDGQLYGLPLVTAEGGVRFFGPAIEGTAESFAVTTRSGRIAVRGNVHLRYRKGRLFDELLADHIDFQLNGKGHVDAVAGSKLKFIRSR